MNENTHMVRIGLNENHKCIDKQEIILVRKKTSHIINEAKKNAKLDSCYICGTPCSSFCKSHSIPQFCLKRIATGGKLFFSGFQDCLPTIDGEFGVKDAGTFQLICHSCDNTLFQDYENPSVYTMPPSGKVLAQIALKKYIQMVSKKSEDLELYSILRANPGFSSEYADMEIDIAKLDLLEYKKGVIRAKQASSGSHNDWYYLCYFQHLDYIIPLAFQGLVTLICDFGGEIINDIYNMSPNYHTKELHIAAFPLESTSVIVLFIDSRDKCYRKFYRQLNALPLDQQLAAINYIIFSYSENVFISKEIDKRVLKDKEFLDVCRKTSEFVSTSPWSQTMPVAKKEFSLSNRNKIPNLLSPEYALPPKSS